MNPGARSVKVMVEYGRLALGPSAAIIWTSYVRPHSVQQRSEWESTSQASDPVDRRADTKLMSASGTLQMTSLDAAMLRPGKRSPKSPAKVSIRTLAKYAYKTCPLSS